MFADGRILAIDGDKWSEEIEGAESPVAWKVTRGDGVPWPTIDIERRVMTAKIERRQGIYYSGGDSLAIAYGEKRPTTILPGEGRVIESYQGVRPPQEDLIFIKPPDDPAPLPEHRPTGALRHPANPAEVAAPICELCPACGRAGRVPSGWHGVRTRTRDGSKATGSRCGTRATPQLIRSGGPGSN